MLILAKCPHISSYVSNFDRFIVRGVCIQENQADSDLRCQSPKYLAVMIHLDFVDTTTTVTYKTQCSKSENEAYHVMG